MCIIVDANKLGAFLADPPDDDSKPILNWLNRGTGRIVYSTEGKFAQEIQGRAKHRLAEYYRQGKATFIPRRCFAAYECDLNARRDLCSDDPHVLALAKAARARLLYTADRNLMKDFTNKNIIDEPRGKVYSRKRHAGLLTGSVCAPPKSDPSR